MNSSLLATKLRIPPQSPRVVQRTRLVDALERDIQDYKLVLLSAPAGYGKTTLLSQWAHASRLPVAWLSLGEDDNDPQRFFRYLLTAWEEAQPGISDSPLGMLLGSRMPDRDAVLSAFINTADRAGDHIVFVLDDYHLIEDASIHQALTFLLDHLPPKLHFVLAGRGEPPLPLARYRARRELLEFRTEDLRFLEDETEEFLHRHMGVELASDEIATLHAQLEGWIAGIQLVALSHRQHRTAGRFAVTGRHRFIADYLRDDVLARLPDETRQFLLQTSILDRLSGSISNAVTSRTDSQQMLESLEHENLFLMPLDDSRQWYRYHRLFADYLQHELTRQHPAEVAELHRRAARWWLEYGLPEPAFQHALEGRDSELVIQLLDRYLFVRLMSGEISGAKAWLDSLPEDWHASHPELGLFQAGLMYFTGQLDACVRCVDDVERKLSAIEREDTRRHVARVAAMRCFIACAYNDLPLAETYADQALRELPQEDLDFRAGIYGALGDTYRGNGLWEEAHRYYLKLLEFSHVPTFRVESVHLFGALADLALQQGRLREAASYWNRALVVIQERESWGRIPLPVIGWVFVRLGEILYEWNQLAEAWDHLSRGLERAELGGDVRSMIAGYLAASRVKLAQGDVEAATDYLEQARPLVEQAAFPEWAARFERNQLDLWLARDQLRAAVNWSDQKLQENALQRHPDYEITHLAIANVLIVKGDRPAIEHALALLVPLLQEADAQGRMRVQIEALALQATAYWRRGDRADAMTALERALRLAEPEGYLRLFSDLGLPMARLLQEALSRAVMPDYVATLLAACGVVPDAPDRLLPEPLTDREQEILLLLAAGLTNREMAAQLFISPETIKKHTGNIYGKLGVRSRTEAVARARELTLLG